MKSTFTLPGHVVQILEWPEPTINEIWGRGAKGIKRVQQLLQKSKRAPSSRRRTPKTKIDG